MSLRPNKNRQLNWKVFEQQDSQSWRLILPTYYAELFAAVVPSVTQKASNGFCTSANETKTAVLYELDELDHANVKRFMDWYGRAVCISTNEHLADHFSDELDFVVALDFNKPSPVGDRTQIGEWEYQAKYHKDSGALAELANELCLAIRMLPLQHIPIPRLLSYVPPDPEKEFCLPANLVDAISRTMPPMTWGSSEPIVTPTLMERKKSAKDLTVAQKIVEWEKLTNAKAIKLSRSVKDHSVIIVDDLYQSGATLWSLARYMKAMGARTVVGVACVKSLRDTDNQ